MMNATIEQAENETKTRLYHLSSVIDDWPHKSWRYADVRVAWLVVERQEPPAPYVQCIESGKQSNPCQSAAVDECFALEEAEALAAYLKKRYDVDCEITEAELPVPEDVMPLCFIPVEGSCNRHMLSEEEGYDLPFAVRGYYDVHQCEPMPDHTAQRELVKHVLDELQLTAETSAVERVASGLRNGGFEVCVAN